MKKILFIAALFLASCEKEGPAIVSACDPVTGIEENGSNQVSWAGIAPQYEVQRYDMQGFLMQDTLVMSKYIQFERFMIGFVRVRPACDKEGGWSKFIYLKG